MLIHHGDGVTGIIDKQLFAGAMILAHDAIQRAGPMPVALTEPAVLIAFRVPCPVLLPEQEQGHVLKPEFLFDIEPVRQCLVPLCRCRRVRKQLLL